MNLNSLAFLVITATSLNADATDSSLLCPQTDSIYKSVHCCPKENCQDGLKNLDSNFLKKISTVTQEIKDSVYPEGATPNCFWTALAYHDSSLLKDPRTVYEWDFEKRIQKDFEKVESPKRGDIVLFQATILTYPDVLGGEALEIELPFHSAIYLGDSRVFQKENSVTDVFSYSELPYTFESYQNGLRESQEGGLKLIYYRRKD